MNIDLSGAKKQGKSSNLGFGLNKRKKKTSTNVFDDVVDDENSDEEDAPDTKKSRRDAVNQEIAAEQAALRKRAMKAMSAQAYDYDGSYDSEKQQKEAKEAANKPSEEKKSRYIQDLLKQSEKRAIEREEVYERKVAREQEEEDAQADYRGKEKFVTKAYKKKLEERQKMAVEDEKQRKIEEQEDVTKRTGGAAMASFYGNMNKNVAMGGENKQNDEPENKKEIRDDTGLRFMEGFERAGGEQPQKEPAKSSTSPQEDASPNKKQAAPPLDPVAVRKAREEKLANARKRYIERNGMLIPQQSVH